MRTYEKIETIFNRDTTGTKKLILGDFRNETVEFLKDAEWVFTEKIDGTNIRIYWDGHKVEFGGRTDNAEIPRPLLDSLNKIFGTTETEELFEQIFGEKNIILLGEGYGGRIQGVGTEYRPDESFILLEVLICENNKTRECVEKTAQMFGIKAVPVLFTGPLQAGIDYVCGHPKSVVAMKDTYMEGVVARPKVELKDRCGRRVIVKIKWKDFKDFAKEN